MRTISAGASDNQRYNKEFRARLLSPKTPGATLLITALSDQSVNLKFLPPPVRGLIECIATASTCLSTHGSKDGLHSFKRQNQKTSRGALKSTPAAAASTGGSRRPSSETVHIRTGRVHAASTTARAAQPWQLTGGRNAAASRNIETRQEALPPLLPPPLCAGENPGLQPVSGNTGSCVINLSGSRIISFWKCIKRCAPKCAT